MIHKQLLGTWKGVQHHWLCENCKLKAQWDSIYIADRMAKIFLKWQQTFYGRNWLSYVQPHWNKVGQILTKLNMHLSFDPEILLLGVYPWKLIMQER